MHWLPTSIPSAAAAMLTKAKAKRGAPGAEYARAQQFVAALYAYSDLPAEARLQLARDYAAHVAAERETKPAETSAARPSAAKLLADRKARAAKQSAPA